MSEIPQKNCVLISVRNVTNWLKSNFDLSHDLSQILTYTSTATEIKFMRDFYVDVWREKNLES